MDAFDDRAITNQRGGQIDATSWLSNEINSRDLTLALSHTVHAINICLRYEVNPLLILFQIFSSR